MMDLLAGGRNPTPKVPVVADAMVHALRAAGPVLQVWFWPDARPFCLSLSHDVDEVRWSWRRRLLMGSRHPRTLFEPNDRYWNFDRVRALERRLGVTSSWYFVADGRHPRDPPYRLSDVAGAMRDLEKDGHEVGVHGTYESYRDGAMLRREREAVAGVLGHPVPGVRQHFINFEAPLTWELQEAAGFSYDATLGLNEASGFRTGFCHPYRPSGRAILEQPMILMDGQLFWYEGFTAREATANCEDLARRVIERNGLLTLNWHQHTYDGYSFPGWWDVYERLVPSLLRREPAVMTGEQVWRWWTLRESVCLIRTAQEGRRGTYELRAPEPVRGVALRMSNVAQADFTSNVQTRTVERGGERFLVLDLPPAEPVTVTVEW